MLLLKHKAFIVVAASVVSLASAVQSFAQGPRVPDDSSRISSKTTTETIKDPVELWRAGIYAGMNRNIYSADRISGLPTVPSCCPSYSSGGGFGAVLGWTGSLPLGGNWGLNLRVAYNSYGGSFRTEELETVDANHERVLATFEHTIEALVRGVSVESQASYKIYPRLFASAGFRGDFLLEKWFYQREFLASPQGITYENGKRTRMEFEGNIPQANSLLGAVTAGLRYDLPLSRRGDIVLSPELSAWYGLSDVVKDLPWGIHGIRVGVSLQFIRLRWPERRRRIEPIRSGPLVPSATDHGPEAEKGEEEEAKGEGTYTPGEKEEGGRATEAKEYEYPSESE